MTEFEERIGLTFSLDVLSQNICKVYKLGEFVGNKLIQIGYEDYNYILTTTKGKFVVKVFSHLRSDTDCQNLADRATVPKKYDFSCPEIFYVDDKNLYIVTINNVKFRLVVMEYIDGKDFFTLNKLPTIGELGYIGKETAKLNQIDYRPPFIYDRWAVINFEKEYNQNIRLIDDNTKVLIKRVYQEFQSIDFTKLKYGYVHGDIIETNVLQDKNKKLWFIDFSVANYMPRIVDLAVTICDLCLDLMSIKKTLSRVKAYLGAYERVYPLSVYEKECLRILLKCHQAITVLETTKDLIEEGNNSQENLRFLEKGKQGLEFVFNNQLF